MVALGSVYIGSAKISYNTTTNEIEWVRLRNQIPVYLVAKNFQDSNITPLGTPYSEISVHAWVALARTFLGNERLSVRDVFPSANNDWRVTPILQAPAGAAFKVLPARCG